MAHRAVLVYWQGADWSTVSGLLDAGVLPHLNTLVERGVISVFDPPFPPLPDSLYVSAITGVPADRHGILASVDCDPLTGKLRGALSHSLRSKPIYELAGEHGKRSIAVGCPALYPIVNFPGVAIAREIFSGVRRPGQPWAPPPDAVACRTRIAELCLRPEELTTAELLPFLPDLANIDQQRDSTAGKLAVELSQTASLHAIATSLMGADDWDFAAVAPSLIGACDADLRRPEENLQRHLLESCYRLADEMLGTFIRVAGRDAVFMVVSGGGAGGRRGFLCLAGAGTREDVILHNGGLLDVAPTLLHVLGCPVPAELPGSPLVPLPVARSRTAVAITPPDEGAHDWIAQLRVLGYRDPAGRESEANAARVARERTFNLAGVYLSTNRAGAAAQVLEDWRSAHPGDSECEFRLCYTSFLAGRFETSRKMLSAIAETSETRPVLTVIRAYLAVKDGRWSEGLELLDAADAEDPGNSAPLTYLIGSLYFHLRRFEAADAAFGRIAAAYPDCWPAWDGRARALHAAGQLKESAEALRHRLSLNFMSAQSHTRLALALLGLGDGAGAATAFRIAAALP